MSGISSMTGYGRAEVRGTRLAVLVEARALNHRFLELGIKLTRGLSAQEPEVRRLAQGRLSRGRVDLTAVARRIGGSQSVVGTDVALGADYLRGARALAETLGLQPELTLADLLRLPGVLSLEEADEDDGEGGLLLKEAAQQALDELVRMRQAEGAALAADLGAHVSALEAWAVDFEGLLPAALQRIQSRVRARIQALLADAPVDPGRMVQEAATWAAKSDVAEEVVRLRSHCGQFRALLGAGGAVGRQLDFLGQEMHREVNTIASKADDAEMITGVLEARTVIERIREQAQNVE